jgi:hypothetical protein
MSKEPLVTLHLTYNEVALIREALFQHGYKLISFGDHAKARAEGESMERLRQKIMSVWTNSINGEGTWN